jgi:hypothetical protein
METYLTEQNLSIILATYDKLLVKDSLRLLKEKYTNTPIILSTIDFNSKQGPVKGCNFFYKASMSSIARELSKEDLIPMTQKISELFINKNKLEDINNTYEDSGFTIYPKEGSSPILWKHLREQTKTYCPNINLDKPFVIEGLVDISKDDKFEYGLKVDFNKCGLTIVTQVPILSKGDGIFSSEDRELQKTGFPSKLGQGNRTLYTANNGVRGFYRSGYLNLGARNDNLADSNDTGRVHFAKNFSGLTLEEIINNQSLLESIRNQALERATQNYEVRKKIIESV